MSPMAIFQQSTQADACGSPTSAARASCLFPFLSFSMVATRIVSPEIVPVTFTFLAANCKAFACGSRRYTLLPDHKPYFDPSLTHRRTHCSRLGDDSEGNLITFCTVCHVKAHRTRSWASSRHHLGSELAVAKPERAAGVAEDVGRKSRSNEA
jgi:hypothetical protein